MELKIVKNKLNFAEYTEFINNVIYTVFTFDEDNHPTSYMPELYDFAFKLEFAETYLGYDSTDKDTNTMYEEVGFIDMKAYGMGKDTDDFVVDYKQFHSIEDAIYSKIDFLKQQLLNQSKKDSLSELLDSINSFVKTMEEKFKDVDLSNIDGLGQLGKKIEGLSDTKIVNALVKEISKNNGKTGTV